MTLNSDVVVIGAGPAGMSASIYLKRSGVNVIMIEGVAPGGQINRTDKIENYLGYLKIDGPSLAYNMFMQTQEIGIVYKYGHVIDVIDNKDHKVVKTDKEEITCKAVIIATGRKPRELGLENEKKLVGRGVSWCAICDGPLFKNKDVAVVGGGNSALEESLYLAGLANKVTLIHRRDQFKGDKLLQERVFNEPKIEVMFDTIVTKLNEQNNVLDSIEIENSKNNEKKELPVSGLFIYIGFEPTTNLFTSLKLNNNGYIMVDENMRTNIDHIYACGDVIDKELYQIATAVGEGAIAAISAVKDLDNN